MHGFFNDKIIALRKTKKVSCEILSYLHYVRKMKKRIYVFKTRNALFIESWDGK